MLSCTCGLDAAIAAHVEAQRPGKVLTDEELERYYQKRRLSLAESGLNATDAHNAASEYKAGMMQARLRYLAPAHPKTMPLSFVVMLLKELDVARNHPAQYQKRIQGWSVADWQEVARQKVLMKYNITS